MTVQEVITEIRQLSVEDRLQVLESLTHSLREDWKGQPRQAPSPAAQVRGLLKTDAPPPTGAQIKDAYIDYLVEKYN
jgi:hypothetical protein